MSVYRSVATEATVMMAVAEFETGGIVDKEVAVECVADLQQEFGVDTAAVEDFIDIRAVAVEFLREPYYRSLLRSQFVLDNSADKNFVHNSNSVIKEGGTNRYLSPV